MSKWTLLLDKNTFVNFQYLKSLVLRYQFINLFFVSLLTFAIWFQYTKQHEIYLRELAFISNKSSSPKIKVNPFENQNSNKLNINELRGITESWEFINLLVDKVTAHSSFSEFVFTSEFGQKLTSKELAAECSNSLECSKSALAKILPEQFKIVKNVGIPGFTLRVHGFEEGTIRILENMISELLLRSRYEQLSKGSNSKKVVLEQMIKERQDKIGISNVDEVNEQIKIKTSEVKDIEKSIREVQFMRNKEKARLFEVDLKLKYLVNNAKVRSTDRAKLAKVRKLEKTIIKLTENIELLKLNNSTGENDEVIRKLIKSRKQAKLETKKLGVLNKSVNTYANAQKNRNEIVPNLIVQSNVIKENVRKLASEMSNLSKDRETLLKTKSKLKTKLDQIEPEIEILNQIKRQYSENVIKQSSLKSDIEFESIRPETTVLKQHSIKKMIFLNFVFSAFIILFVTLFRFFMDKSVYTKKEIETLCHGLDVLGESSKVVL